MVLRLKLPALSAQAPEIDLPLFHSALAEPAARPLSLENYRKVHGARLESTDALQFLLFDPHAPRSLRFGTAAVKDLLEQISGGERAGAAGPRHRQACQRARLPGRRRAAATADACRFLDHVLSELSRTHETLSATYFGT